MIYDAHKNLTDDELNRRIAELRGWKISPYDDDDASEDHPIIFRSMATYPDCGDYYHLLETAPDDLDAVWKELLDPDWECGRSMAPDYCGNMNDAIILLAELPESEMARELLLKPNEESPVLAWAVKWWSPHRNENLHVTRVRASRAIAEAWIPWGIDNQHKVNKGDKNANVSS